ncbi:sugar ABC transporter substrate-binding protein [Pseudonocardia adelaidensis]|uniref:Sugar ABC transporter substrate-binding protein n=1 Tax=Pseudonocardia adelaidensis TaxID=648754 RepID=A0ABP9NXQ3_9PSEU
MRSRLPALVLALLLATSGSAISGCAISSVAASTPGTTVLTFWQYYDGTQKEWLEAEARRFERDNPGVQIELVQVVGSQQDQKLLASVATGSTPDLFINNIVVDFPTLVAGGVMLDLTPYWESFPDAARFPDTATWRDGGRIYNLMSYTNLVGLYYNQDILDEYGLAPPTTLDELQAAMETVQRGGKYQGIALSGAASVEGAWLFAPQLLGLGVGYCNLAESAQQVTDAFRRIAAWRATDALPRAAATWNQNASWQQFMTGRYAFALNGNWQLGNVEEAGFRYGTAQFPAPAGGQSQVFPGGEGFAIGSKSQHPDLAWRFLEQLMSPESGLAVYEAAGSIPLHEKAAAAPEIQDDPMVAPFVAATRDAAPWPNNPNTAAMQKALGVAVSSVISGEQPPEAGARDAIESIGEAREQGGGGCA